MNYFLEILDWEGAQSTSASLSALGQRLQPMEAPPEPHWGDDKFGQAMQAQFPAELAATVPVTQIGLKEAIEQLGEVLSEALAEFQEQDDAAADELRAI
ncbi:MAG TPA: hypothetical protein VKZ67_05200 [Natronosporangium sp.]|nr:hypothetical protein [Natronosporangium sp.]